MDARWVGWKRLVSRYLLGKHFETRLSSNFAYDPGNQLRDVVPEIICIDIFPGSARLRPIFTKQAGQKKKKKTLRRSRISKRQTKRKKKKKEIKLVSLITIESCELRNSV